MARTRAQAAEHRLIREVANEAAQKAATEAVHQVLEKFGVDVDNPIEVQQDMAFMRKLRTGSTSMSTKIFLGIIAATLTGLTSLLVLGFKSWIGGH